MFQPVFPTASPPQDDTRILTACGDTTVGIWDTVTTQQLAHCVGHSRAVKSLSTLEAGGDVFATGGAVQ